MSVEIARTPAEQQLIDAMRLHAQGDLEGAKAGYESVLKTTPNQPDALHCLGVIYLGRQEYERAAEYFRKALEANPRGLKHGLQLARVLSNTGDLNGATEVLVNFLMRDPMQVEAVQELLKLCKVESIQADDRRDKMIMRLINTHPNVLGLRYLPIGLFEAIKRIEESLPHFKELLKGGIDSEEFFKLYTTILRNSGHQQECIDVCTKALPQYPHSIHLLKMRGSLRLAVGEHEGALEDWKKAAALDPVDTHTRASMGIIKLLLSDCTDGFDDYSAQRDHELDQRKMDMKLREWNGEDLKDKHLMIWNSQGVGDVIMFASLIPWVLEQGAKVTLVVYPKLIPLFARSFPQIRVAAYAREVIQEFEKECDYQIIIGELMKHVLPKYTPAQHPAYLKADPLQTQRMRAKYLEVAKQNGKKRLVGISWFTENKDNFAQRNIPLMDWKPLFELPDVQYVSLQYGNHNAEIEAVNKKIPGAVYVDPDMDGFNDNDGLAAQICAMDEVVSIQNATVHMSGALGVPVTIMLSAASDWRWGLKRTDSRWYKSVYIARQEKLGDWRPLLNSVRDKLR